MSFFAGSSRIAILGGTFTNNLPTPNAGRCISRNADGLMIVQADEVDLHRELTRGNRYRTYSASHGGRFVVVRTFEGPRAKQDWAVNMALSGKVFHPNVLKISGVSDESSKNHFVLLHGITSEKKMQSLIAEALRTDLNTSVQLSMKAVKGIAAGLSYLKSQNIPMRAGRLNFDIFVGHENEPVISFHPSTTADDDGSIFQNFDIETGDHGIEALNKLCQELFSGVNSILYDDSPERKFDAYNREDHLTVTLEDSEGTLNASESEATLNPSSSTEKSKSSPAPRREVWWLDLGAKNQCLESIKQCFEDCLDRFLVSKSNPLLRCIRSPKDNTIRRNLHQCPGYLREEITLTSDVSRSAIVSHAFPSQSELCSICGQLVQYTYSDPSITDEEIELSEDVHQGRENMVHGSFTMDVKSSGQHAYTQPRDLTFAFGPSSASTSPPKIFGNNRSPKSSGMFNLSVTSTSSPTFGAAVTKPIVPSGAPVFKGFNIAATGMKVPSKNLEAWICSLCALSNPSSALKCQTCDITATSEPESMAVDTSTTADGLSTLPLRFRRERESAPTRNVGTDPEPTPVATSISAGTPGSPRRFDGWRFFGRRDTGQTGDEERRSAFSSAPGLSTLQLIERSISRRERESAWTRNVGTDPESTPVATSTSTGTPGGPRRTDGWKFFVRRETGRTGDEERRSVFYSAASSSALQLIERSRRERESARARNVDTDPKSTPVATSTPTGTPEDPRRPDGQRFFMRRETGRTGDEWRSAFSSAAAQHINQS